MPRVKNPFTAKVRSSRSSGRNSSRVAVLRASADVQPAFQDKRQLILAHTARRRTRPDPAQVALLWTGVITTFVVVLAAWGYVTLPRILQAVHRPMPEIQMVSAGLQHATEVQPSAQIDDLARRLSEVSLRLQALNQDAISSQKALDTMAYQIEATSSTYTTTSRLEFFQATSSISSSSSSR